MKFGKVNQTIWVLSLSDRRQHIYLYPHIFVINFWFNQCIINVFFVFVLFLEPGVAYVFELSIRFSLTFIQKYNMYHILLFKNLYNLIQIVSLLRTSIETHWLLDVSYLVHYCNFTMEVTHTLISQSQIFSSFLEFSMTLQVQSFKIKMPKFLHTD